jgi:hypothetical protein
MGTVCIFKPNRRDSTSLFAISSSSWGKEGFFNDDLLDLTIDEFIEIQEEWSYHWKKIPSSEKSLRYLIPK